ncbi:MAG TPA: VWA domain-containing protein [Anaerolineales bacterium]|nr:VWA domain-containing protein [Anaerolineales bacterium]
MASDRADYYALLGLLREASQEEIKHAYYEAAQRLHPDKNQTAGETELFLEVQRAYEVLSNVKRRAQYDATLPKESTPLLFVKDTVEYSRPNLVRLEEPQLIYVLLEMSPRNADEKIPAPPLNLCLVLDRSTSMQGDKMDLVKAAASQLMRTMRSQDIFSVVSFSDRAEVIIPASYQTDRTKLQSRIQMIRTGGATEIYQGLEAGMQEIRRNLDTQRVSHLILLTDGQTYGDEQACLQLAEEAASKKVGISGLGIGNDWNDIFLDALTSRTGNNSAYISNPQEITKLLMEKFNSITNTLAEDILLEFKLGEGVSLNYAFRLQPEGGPLVLDSPMHLGPILQDTPLTVIFEFVVEPSASKSAQVGLLDGSLKMAMAARPMPVPPLRVRFEQSVSDTPGDDPPPLSIIRALSRLTLYRMQERAREEAQAGHYESATRHLKNLAQHLLDQGEKDLAKTALLEANNLERMQSLSENGGKEIKYGTRALLLSAAEVSK